LTIYQARILICSNSRVFRFKIISVKKIAPYLISQIAGAFAATLILRFLFPENQNLGSTLPRRKWHAVICFGIYSYLFFNDHHFIHLARLRKNPTIGRTRNRIRNFTWGHVCSPICCASMNPARSLAPELISGNIQTIWIYLLAPVFGSLSVSFSYKFLAA
jgi:glycerol uptake facilitator-like aquaporin